METQKPPLPVDAGVQVHVPRGEDDGVTGTVARRATHCARAPCDLHVVLVPTSLPEAEGSGERRLARGRAVRSQATATLRTGPRALRGPQGSEPRRSVWGNFLPFPGLVLSHALCRLLHRQELSDRVGSLHP